MDRKKVLLILSPFLLLLLILGLVFVLAPERKPVTPVTSLIFPTPTLFPISTSLTFPAIIPSPGIISPTTTSTLGEVQFTYQTQQFPSVLDVYQTADQQLTEQTILEISSKFSFTTTAEKSTDGLGRNHFNWSSPSGEQLHIIQETGYIQFLGKDQKFSQVQTPNTPEQVLTLAKYTLQQFGLLSSLMDTNDKNLVYYTEPTQGDEEQTTSFSDATVYQVYFFQKINDRIITRQYANQSIGSVWLSKNGGVRKVSLQYSPLVAKQQYPIFSLDEAEEKIRQGEGTVVYLEGEDQVVPQEETLSTTIFTSVELEYFEDFQTRFVSPVFVFSGISQTSTETKKIIVYLPGLK